MEHIPASFRNPAKHHGRQRGQKPDADGLQLDERHIASHHLDQRRSSVHVAEIGLRGEAGR